MNWSHQKFYHPITKRLNKTSTFAQDIESYILQGHYHTALRLLNPKLLRPYKNIPILNYYRGLLNLFLFNLKDSFNNFQEYLFQSQTILPEHHYFTGLLYFLLKKKKACFDSLKQTIFFSKDPILQYQSLLMLRDCNIKIPSQHIAKYIVPNEQKILNSLSTTLKNVNQTIPKAQYLHALKYIWTQENRKSFHLLQTIVDEHIQKQKHPFSPEILRFWMLAALKCKQYFAVNHRYETSYKLLFQNNVYLTSHLAEIFYHAKHFKNAKHHLSILMKKQPLDSTNRIHQGHVFIACGQLWKAIFSYLKALELNPDCHVARFNIAVLYHKIGLIGMAKEHYQMLTKKTKIKDEILAKSKYNLSLILYEEKQYPHAFKELIEIKTNSLQEAQKIQDTFKYIKLLQQLEFQRHIIWQHVFFIWIIMAFTLFLYLLVA